jgi:hypothetical protein
MKFATILTAALLYSAVALAQSSSSPSATADPDVAAVNTVLDQMLSTPQLWRKPIIDLYNKMNVALAEGQQREKWLHDCIANPECVAWANSGTPPAKTTTTK